MCVVAFGFVSRFPVLCSLGGFATQRAPQAHPPRGQRHRACAKPNRCGFFGLFFRFQPCVRAGGPDWSRPASLHHRPFPPAPDPAITPNTKPHRWIPTSPQSGAGTTC